MENNKLTLLIFFFVFFNITLRAAIFPFLDPLIRPQLKVNDSLISTLGNFKLTL